MSLDPKYGIDPAAQDNCAFRCGHDFDAVKYLMSLDSKYGINAAAGNNYAIRNRNVEIVKYLIRFKV